MYRNKSAVSLRTLAHSLKQSITIDRQKAQSREFVPLRNSASSINLMGTNNGTKVISNNKNHKTHEQYLLMQQTRKLNNYAFTQHQYNRTSNYSQVRYDIRGTRELMMQRKERLLEMTRANSYQKFPFADKCRTALPQRQSDQLTCALNMLKQEQSKLTQVISQNYASNNIKSCNKIIVDAEKVGNQLREITVKYGEFIQYKKQLENRQMFLEEDILSTKMNFNELVAEKDDCEQFLSTYHQDLTFHEEANHVMALVALQYQNQYVISNQIYQLSQQLLKHQTDYTLWKAQENVQFKENKFHNKLKQQKLQLMKIQTDLDSITNQLVFKYQKQDLPPNTIKKIREYICAFFKYHTNLTPNPVSYRQIDDGIDFFLCKRGLVKQFSKFLNQSTQKISLTHGIYSLKLTQYIDSLFKIQHLYHLHDTQVNKVIADKFQQHILCIKQQIQTLNMQKRSNLSQIQSLLHKIQKILSQDCLSIIELMNKKIQSKYSQFNKQQGLFNLGEIKSKVKQNKFQQQKRIMKAKQHYIRLKQLQQRLEIYGEEHSKNESKWAQQKQALLKDIKVWSQKIQQIQVIKQGYECKKAKLDSIIDQTITKIKEKDDAQVKLTSIQKEIEQLKKQKIQDITKKHQTRKTNQEFTLANNIKSISRPFSSVTNLKQFTQKAWPNKLDPCLPDTLFQLGTLKLSQNPPTTQNNLQQSAQFKIARDLHPTRVKITVDEEKISTKTQSSPKNCQQRLSLGALNSILLSKCNLVHSKNLQTQSKTILRSGSTCGGKKINKENELKEDDLLLESKNHSRKNSNLTKKEKTSRKNSVGKNTQRSTAENQASNVSTGKKLSLSTNTGKPSISNKVLNKQRQSPYTKASKPQKDLNSLITKKLLRR